MSRTENMRNYTEGRKQETICKIKDAISMMKLQGRPITRKELVAESGVSSSVLSKPYIKAILEEEQVLMFQNRQTIASNDSVSASMEKELCMLRKRIEELEHRILDKDLLLESRKKYYQEKLDGLEKENAILRGKNQKILEYLYRRGMVDKEIDDLYKY